MCGDFPGGSGSRSGALLLEMKCMFNTNSLIEIYEPDGTRTRDTHLLWKNFNDDLVNQIVRERNCEGIECWCVKLAGSEEYLDDSFMTQEKAELYCKLHGHFVHAIFR